MREFDSTKVSELISRLAQLRSHNTLGAESAAAEAPMSTTAEKSMSTTAEEPMSTTAEAPMSAAAEAPIQLGQKDDLIVGYVKLRERDNEGAPGIGGIIVLNRDDIKLGFALPTYEALAKGWMTEAIKMSNHPYHFTHDVSNMTWIVKGKKAKKISQLPMSQRDIWGIKGVMLAKRDTPIPGIVERDNHGSTHHMRQAALLDIVLNTLAIYGTSETKAHVNTILQNPKRKRAIQLALLLKRVGRRKDNDHHFCDRADQKWTSYSVDSAAIYGVLACCLLSINSEALEISDVAEIQKAMCEQTRNNEFKARSGATQLSKLGKFIEHVMMIIHMFDLNRIFKVKPQLLANRMCGRQAHGANLLQNPNDFNMLFSELLTAAKGLVMLTHTGIQKIQVCKFLTEPEPTGDDSAKTYLRDMKDVFFAYYVRMLFNLVAQDYPEFYSSEKHKKDQIKVFIARQMHAFFPSNEGAVLPLSEIVDPTMQLNDRTLTLLKLIAKMARHEICGMLSISVQIESATTRLRRAIALANQVIGEIKPKSSEVTTTKDRLLGFIAAISSTIEPEKPRYNFIIALLKGMQRLKDTCKKNLQKKRRRQRPHLTHCLDQIQSLMHFMFQMKYEMDDAIAINQTPPPVPSLPHNRCRLLSAGRVVKAAARIGFEIDPASVLFTLEL